MLSPRCGRQGDDAREDNGERAPAPRCGVRDVRLNDGSGSRGSAPGGGGGRSTGAGVSLVKRSRVALASLGGKGETMAAMTMWVCCKGKKDGAWLSTYRAWRRLE